MARATQRDARPPFQKRQGTGLWWEGGGGPEDVKAGFEGGRVIVYCRMINVPESKGEKF